MRILKLSRRVWASGDDGEDDSKAGDAGGVSECDDSNSDEICSNGIG